MTERPKYSLLEIEKRWIVDQNKLPDLSELIKIEVIDKYFLDTRLRLRRMYNTQTHEVIYKLTKKYGKLTQYCEPLTTIYLSKSEYDFYNMHDGMILRKDLYRYNYFDKIFLIEDFIEPAVDFMLLEVEASSEDELHDLKIPDFAEEDVAQKKEYEGYSIATGIRKDDVRFN